MKHIQKFNESLENDYMKRFKINEEDDFDEEDEEDYYDENDNSSYLKHNNTYVIMDLEKLINRCLHDIEKERLKKYIIDYIDKSTITMKPGGHGFYGADTGE
jgi:hypothetical protein